MTNWSSIDANQLLPSTVMSAVKTASDVLSSTLEDAANAFTLPTLPSIPSAGDATKAVVNGIIGTLASLLKGAGIHMLTVPIVKTVPQKPPPALPPTLNDLQDALQITLGPSNTSYGDTYANMLAKTGGNAGFFNTFAASLMDPQDLNRPQYDTQTSAVAMAVLLIGAPRFASITAAASMLDQLTQPKSGNGLAARTVPIPQNLTTRVVGSARGVGVRLDWDAPRTVFGSTYFPGVRMTAKRYAIIRSTNVKAQSARSVLDFFPSQKLTEGLTAQDAKVVAIGSGSNSAYLDTDANDPTKPVYYCIAWEVSVTESGGTVILPFDRVSNVTKVIPRAPTPPQTGTAPDWVAMRASIDAIPALSRAAQRVVEETKVLLAPSNDPTARLNGAMKLAQDASTRLTARATDLLNDVTRLSSSLARPIPSLYVTQMSSAIGGNAFLLAELSKRLGDTSDTSRPPFDNGEYVCGVCFVAGAPRLADLASTLAFFNALFGPATATNPLLGLLAAINTTVVQAEATVFQPNMKPFPPRTTGIDPVTGKPPVPAPPVIGADGKPVAVDDPNNPNTGNTNVTLPSELC